MTRWRRLHYSLAGGLIITSLALLFDRVERVFLMPGEFTEIALSFLSGHSSPAGVFVLTWRSALLNVLFYSFGVFIFTWVMTALKGGQKS